MFFISFDDFNQIETFFHLLRKRQSSKYFINFFKAQVRKKAFLIAFFIEWNVNFFFSNEVLHLQRVILET